MYNRNGLPKLPSKYLEMTRIATIESLVMPHAKEAVQLLIECMRDVDAPWPARTRAAELTLSYAYGKPVDRVQLATIDSASSDTPSQLTTAQLIAALTPVLESKRDSEALEHCIDEHVAPGDIPPPAST